MPAVWTRRPRRRPWRGSTAPSLRRTVSGRPSRRSRTKLRATGRLRPADASPLPVATPDPGLTPATVVPVDRLGPAGRWLGWETIFVVTAFALPGVASAVSILAQHVGGVSDLNEFDLPLPHHPGVSLVLVDPRLLDDRPHRADRVAAAGPHRPAAGAARARPAPAFVETRPAPLGILAGVAVINIVVGAGVLLADQQQAPDQHRDEQPRAGVLHRLRAVRCRRPPRSTRKSSSTATS